MKFKKTLSSIGAITEETIRESKLIGFWDSLKGNNKMLFLFEDSVAKPFQAETLKVVRNIHIRRTLLPNRKTTFLSNLNIIT